MPKTKTYKPRNTSQTAKILENIELLVALHEEHETRGPLGDQDLSSLEDSIQQSVTSLIDRRFDQLADDLVERTRSSADQPNNDDALDRTIEQKIGKVIDQRVAKFEQKFEQLVLEKIDSIGTLAPQTTGQEAMDAVIESISERLNRQSDKLVDTVTELVQATDSDRAVSGSETQRTQDMLTEFQTTLVGFKDQLSALKTTFDQQTREWTKAQELHSNVRELVKTLASAAPTDPHGDSQTDSVTESTSADDSSHWQKQKEAMLAKYGIDPEYRPLEQQPKTVGVDEPQQPTATELDQATAVKLEDLHNTIDAISPEDKDAIEQLKEDLNAKLRDAEVELSINRARMSQERMELEQKQAELERRAADLQRKLQVTNPSDHKNKKSGLMTRLTRHLGK